MLFNRNTGEQTISKALDIFSKATAELKVGISLLDKETALAEKQLAIEEEHITKTATDFKKAQERREVDFKKQHDIAETKCDTVRKATVEKCGNIKLAKDKATKIITNIENMLG